LTLTPSRFEEEIVALLPDLYGAALRLAKNSADAEDLVAEAVAKAWLNRETLRNPASFRGWVFRILTNDYLSRYRARAAAGVVESLDQEDSAQEEPFSLFEQLHQPILLWWGNPEQEFLDRLLREDLEHAVDTLPESFRLVVVLADIQGLRYKEIAESLQLPVGTVRSRLARGRGLLQQALTTHAADAGLKPTRTRTPEGRTHDPV
jgi:RNA polymerase sigma-70 factor (ECF subfamily)